MSVLKKIENGPRSPAPGATGSCRPSNGRQDFNDFFLNLQRGPWQGVCGGRGACCPPRATGVSHSFEPKNYTKNLEKKRGEEKKNGEALPNSAQEWPEAIYALELIACTSASHQCCVSSSILINHFLPPN